MIDGRTDRSGVSTQNRRQEIIQAAVGVFYEQGYEGASTREIAAKCQLKQGHLYYYFPAKQDLLYTIVDDLHERFVTGMDCWTADSSGTPVNVLRTILRRHVELLCEQYMETFVSYQNFRFLDGDRRHAIVAKRSEYEDCLRLLIEACGSRYSKVPKEVVTRALLGIINWPYQWYSPDGPYSAHELANWLADTGISALALKTKESQG